MEIKLFGKTIFEFRKSKGKHYIELATNEMKKSKYLQDFWQAGNRVSDFEAMINEGVIEEVTVDGKKIVKKGGKKKTPATKETEKITPKGVYELQLLHDKKFQLNTNPEYVDQQLAAFTDKLNLLSSEEYDMRRGVEEVSSIVARMENRKKYQDYAVFFEQYAYTTSSKIQGLLKQQDHLKMGQIAQFLADMPKEAVDAMKDYNKVTNDLCGKQAVFYIIADKKDFKNTETRRDPILLAQSPFGHFWQILGAWDKEMIFLEEL